MNTIQVNNIQIKWNKLYEKWQAIGKNKIVYEEFTKKEDAIDWANKTKDFTVWNWMKQKDMANAKKRCRHCPALVNKSNNWWCDEGDCSIVDVRDCKEWNGKTGRI